MSGSPAAVRDPVSWTETHVYRVVAGRIVANWPAVDFEALARSLR